MALLWLYLAARLMLPRPATDRDPAAVGGLGRAYAGLLGPGK